MKKIFITIVAFIALSCSSLILSSCGAVDKIDANLTGHTTHCIDNVEYIQFPRGASVAYNIDGTVKTCGNINR